VKTVYQTLEFFALHSVTVKGCSHRSSNSVG